MNITKECTKCHIEKPLFDFNRQAKSKDGYRYECKDCISIRNKNRYHSKNFNKKKYIKKVKQWNEKNKKKLFEYIKKYRFKQRNKV